MTGISERDHIEPGRARSAMTIETGPPREFVIQRACGFVFLFFHN